MKARVPGSTALRARISASMMGRWYFSWRSLETVDLPVAMPPVKPTISMLRTKSAGDDVPKGCGGSLFRADGGGPLKP